MLETQVSNLIAEGKMVEPEQIRFLKKIFLKIITLRNNIALLDPYHSPDPPKVEEDYTNDSSVLYGQVDALPVPSSIEHSKYHPSSKKPGLDESSSSFTSPYKVLSEML